MIAESIIMTSAIIGASLMSLALVCEIVVVILLAVQDLLVKLDKGTEWLEKAEDFVWISSGVFLLFGMIVTGIFISVAIFCYVRSVVL